MIDQRWLIDVNRDCLMAGNHQLSIIEQQLPSSIIGIKDVCQWFAMIDNGSR